MQPTITDWRYPLVFLGGMKVQTLNHYIAIFPSNTGIS